MSTFQSVEVTATTNDSGYATFTFDNNIDKVMGAVNGPQENPGNLGISCLVIGTKKVQYRVWKSDGTGGITLAKNAQVTVTLLGITG